MFESIRSKSKENLKNARNILERLDCEIYNKELMYIIGDHLGTPLKGRKYYIDFSSRNEICIKKKKSEDLFRLLVTPSLDKINTIGIHIIEKNGLYEKNIVVQFKDNQVVVTKIEIEKRVQGKKQEVISILNKTTINNYLDSNLRYRYEYETETCFRLNQNYSCSTLAETFIDLDKKAVKRVAHISEDACYDIPADIVYYESEDCDLLPFSNKYLSKMEMERMTLSTEEKFNEFVNGSNNMVNLRRKK